MYNGRPGGVLQVSFCDVTTKDLRFLRQTGQLTSPQMVFMAASLLYSCVSVTFLVKSLFFLKVFVIYDFLRHLFRVFVSQIFDLNSFI